MFAERKDAFFGKYPFSGKQKERRIVPYDSLHSIGKNA
jgi:hypothetical protein